MPPPLPPSDLRISKLILAVRDLTAVIRLLVLVSALLWIFVILAEIARFVGK